MNSKFLAMFRKLPDEWRETAYWFIALLGVIPALRADLLFPHAWTAALDSSYAMPPVDNPYSVFAAVLALAVAGLAATSRHPSRWIAVVPFIAVVIADSVIGNLLHGLNSVYVISAFLVFVYFVLFGEVASLAFAGFVGLLAVWQWFDGLLAWPQILVLVIAMLVMRLVVEAFTQNWPLVRQLGRSNVLQLARRTLGLWWPMLILIAIGTWASNFITSGTEQLVYERGYVNRYCSIGDDNPLSVMPCPLGSEEPSVLKADRLVHLPMPDHNPDTGPAPAAMCMVREPVVEVAVPAPPAERFVCPVGESASEWQLLPLDYFDNLDRTVQRRYDIAEWQMHRQLQTIDRGALRSAGRADDEAKRLFSVVPKTTGMTTSTCEFPYVACAAANIVIVGLNSAYDKARQRTEQRFVTQMKTRADDAADQATDLTAVARDSLGEHLAESEARTRQFIARVHTASNVIRQILLLWLIVVAVKSFLYVFARVIFDQSTDIDIDLLDRDGTPAEGRVHDRQEINIPGSYASDIYYKANYQPLGPAARFSIPQWRASAMSRLRFGAWNMSRVAMPLADERGVTFNSIEAEHLVDWELQEGEEVVFSYRNFVAMNSNIQLRTVISLRVATLLLGRIVFHTARCSGGPGRLILRTRGKPATAEQVRQSIPAARLVAWNRYARFSVDSHLTLADIFLNGFNLRRGPADTDDGPQGILVVEADARDGGLLVGTLRFAKNFLLPI
ncbi:MAG: hypothetical protein RIA65_05540 [Woeseia sp.]